MKEINAVTEYLRLVISLNSEPLSRMQFAETRVKFVDEFLRKTWWRPYLFFHF